MDTLSLVTLEYQRCQLPRRALLRRGQSMPETIGFLILNAVAEGGPIAGFGWTAGTAAIVGNVVIAGALVGANYALNAQKPESSPQDGQVSVRQPRAARRRNYGLVKIGGALVFSEVLAGTRHQVLALNHGEIESFEQLWLTDSIAGTDGAGRVTTAYLNSGNPCVILKPLLGTESDVAYADLISAFPDYWTSAHQGKGIAKVLTFTSQPESKNFTKVYPGGAPPLFRAIIKAVKVWDPRDGAQNKDLPSTWTWSENPVLIALDFHRHADGIGLATFDASFFTSAAISEDWIPAANICEEAIALKAGGSELRYRCGGGYELQAAPKDVLNAILATCDGETYQRSDGAIGIRVGRLVDPDVTISDKHILSYSNFITGAAGGITPVNVVTAKYTARDLDFQESDADPWRDEDSIAASGREETRNLDLTWVPSHSQARRLMKVAAIRLNPEWTVQIITDLDGLRAYGKRYITLQIEELMIDGPAEITSFEILPGNMSMVIGLRSFNQLAYDWDPEHEEGTAPNQPDTTREDETIDNPTSVSTSVSSRVITVTWDASSRIDTTPHLQYRTNPAGPWLDGIISSGTSGFTPTLTVAHYDVQVRFEVGVHSSGWEPVLNINVT